jgi:hypothetical protein
MSADRTRKVCLVVRFPDSTEVRWSKSPPRRGQRLKSQRGAVSFVTEVLTSGQSTYTVTCVGSLAFLEELRGRSSRQLVSDLFWAARRAVRSHADVPEDTAPRPPRGLERRDDWFDEYLWISSENRRREHEGGDDGDLARRDEPLALDLHDPEDALVAALFLGLMAPGEDEAQACAMLVEQIAAEHGLDEQAVELAKAAALERFEAEPSNA